MPAKAITEIIAVKFPNLMRFSSTGLSELRERGICTCLTIAGTLALHMMISSGGLLRLPNLCELTTWRFLRTIPNMQMDIAKPLTKRQFRDMNRSDIVLYFLALPNLKYVISKILLDC
jgi:hypothetical protein